MSNKVNKPIGSSLSEQYIRARAASPPKASPLIANSVSDFRKSAIANEIEQGKFIEGSGSKHYTNGLTQASNATYLVKNAQISSTTGAGGYKGSSGNAIKQTPEIYSPLWLNSNLNLPRDKATINAWSRSFYALNPFVQNAINLHSTYPISKLNIKCSNKEVENFFNEMIEELDLMNVCCQIAQEYYLLGEAFVYTELDESKGKWSRALMQNPDYMIVKRTVVNSESLIMLRPDENLRRIVFSNKPADVEQKKQLNQYIVDSVKRGENIPLDNFHVSFIARKISPYEIRGTGLLVSIFRDLMLYDKYKECKYVQADQMVNPMTVVKVGSADFKPTVADLEAIREMFEAAEYDKDFKLFTHDAVTIERVGYGGQLVDVSGDVTQIIKNIFIGLQVPSVLMDGGSDTTYANGGVAFDLLKQRYMQFRNMMSSWLKRKIFAPISKIQNFYEYKDGKKQLIIPEVDWNHMSLFDADSYVNTLKELSTASGEGQLPRVSTQTLYRSLGLDLEDETRKLRQEQVRHAIAKKEFDALQKMSLNNLRSITDEDEISEESPANDQAGGAAGAAPESPLPGEMGAGAAPPPEMPPMPPPP